MTLLLLANPIVALLTLFHTSTPFSLNPSGRLNPAKVGDLAASREAVHVRLCPRPSDIYKKHILCLWRKCDGSDIPILHEPPPRLSGSS